MLWTKNMETWNEYQKKVLLLVNIIFKKYKEKDNFFNPERFLEELDREKYFKEGQIFKKTEIVEFYWFNNSPNRFHEQQFVTEVEVCNCMHCHFFMP